MKLTAKQAIIRVFEKSYSGERLCNNDILKKYPHLSYNSIKEANRMLVIAGYLSKETKIGSVGKVTYYWKAIETAEDLAFKQFMTMKPTETKQYRHR